jgi:hypothetical protein
MRIPANFLSMDIAGGNQQLKYIVDVLTIGETDSPSGLRYFSTRYYGRMLRSICVTNDHWYVPFVVIIIRSFPHSWLINGFVTRLTRRVPHVEQELLTLPDHLSSPSVCSAVRVARSLVSRVMFCRSLFVLFLLAIVFSVLLRFTALDYPLGVFKLFNYHTSTKYSNGYGRKIISHCKMPFTCKGPDILISRSVYLHPILRASE